MFPLKEALCGSPQAEWIRWFSIARSPPLDASRGGSLASVRSMFNPEPEVTADRRSTPHPGCASGDALNVLRRHDPLASGPLSDHAGWSSVGSQLHRPPLGKPVVAPGA